ncbi:hypothetical protein C5167_006054 [Papaver somniferum]|uniref:Uncharacterized protein n=1 Tax=Papaver somniferum TaxID=3469 RepID=A0A4Y7JFP7_PAPSO|nr:hypothetical protein C5167_006054 [Papaver somniferum]
MVPKKNHGYQDIEGRQRVVGYKQHAQLA